MKSAPKGNRTPVLALRGPRPGPLDDGGVQGEIVACVITTVNYWQVISLDCKFLIGAASEKMRLRWNALSRIPQTQP